MWRCGGSCTSGRPTCSQSVVEPGANAAAGGVAEMVIVWHSAERHALQCSALTAASQYCWLELRATQRCSSPAETVSRFSDCRYMP